MKMRRLPASDEIALEQAPPHAQAPTPADAGGLNVGRPYSKRRRRLALALLVLVVVAVGNVTVGHELEWQRARQQGADLRVKLVGYPVIDPASCGSEDERVLSVFKWAKDNGAYIHPNVSLGFFSLASLPGAPPDTPDITIRGLRATGDIKQGHALFAVPETLLLHVRKLDKHHTLGDIYKRVPQLHDDIGGLAVLLITEALNKSSHLRPYLCSLPEHVPLPVFYSKERYAQTRGALPEAQRAKFDVLVQARRDVIELHYMYLMPVLYRDYPRLFKPSEYSYERFAWAVSLVMSRTWGRRVPAGRKPMPKNVFSDTECILFWVSLVLSRTWGAVSQQIECVVCHRMCSLA